MDSIYLQGSEAVSKAAYSMNNAAEQMQQAVRNLDGVLFQHQQFMTAWLERFEEAASNGTCPRAGRGDEGRAT